MSFESWLENNPLRPFVREQFEVKPLRDATDVGVILHALHFPCGNGTSTALLRRHFSLEKVSAIDRDEELVGAARANGSLADIDFSVADWRSLAFEDGTFDAVFDLADLHNCAEWERGLIEIRRVLKPGGLLLLEELSLDTFTHASGRLFRLLAKHPYETMFTTEKFHNSVFSNRFAIEHFEERNQFGLLKYFIMVARKT